jgi:small GTP-binding protein
MVRDQFDPLLPATVSLDYQTIRLDDSNHHIQFWDTAGQEKYQSIVPTFLRGAQIVLVVFSIVELDSYQKVGMWLQQVQQASPDAQIVLVSNKIDLADSADNLIEDAAVDIDYPNYGYFKTSALSGAGATELLDYIKGVADRC